MSTDMSGTFSDNKITSCKRSNQRAEGFWPDSSILQPEGIHPYMPGVISLCLLALGVRHAAVACRFVFNSGDSLYSSRHALSKLEKTLFQESLLQDLFCRSCVNAPLLPGVCKPLATTASIFWTRPGTRIQSVMVVGLQCSSPLVWGEWS